MVPQKYFVLPSFFSYASFLLVAYNYANLDERERERERERVCFVHRLFLLLRNKTE